MIEVEVARTGAPVLKSDGKALSSLYDPVQEAKKWVERVAPSCDEFGQIVLLGLGSGYEAQILKQKMPKKSLLVVECDAAVIEQCAKLHPQLSAIEILHFRDAGEFLSDERTIRALIQVFRLLRLPASRAKDAEAFTRAEDAILGRNLSSFTAQLESRPELKEILKVEELPNEKALSIRDLNRVLKVQSGLANQSLRIQKILDELFR